MGLSPIFTLHVYCALCRYYAESKEPDPRCLSYTHDRDFGEFLDYPPGKENFRGGGWCPPAHACYDSMAPELWRPNQHQGGTRGRPRRVRDEL